ncbi:MAG: hypothetical protein PHI96_07605, partial [Desulfovibrio sp.]|nr:hypothetical protein [Desulfovibrio sp.]
YAAAYFEHRQRINQNPMVDRVETWCADKPGGLSPGAALLLSSLHRSLWQITLYCLSFVVVFSVLHTLQNTEALPALRAVTWSALYVAALLGAVLSLRTRQAYMVLTGCLALLAMLIWTEH